MTNHATFLRNIQRFRLVTFDITDTLIRFSRAPAVQYAKTAAEVGITGIDQSVMDQCFKKEFKKMMALHPNWGYSTPDYSWQQWWAELVKNIFRCVTPDVDAGTLNILAKRLIDIYRTNECYCHIEGGQELLAKMRAAGKTVGVISNSDPSLGKVLKAMNLREKFDFVITSYDVGFQKPHKEIFESCLKISNFSSKEALHIGNMYELDYMGAKNAGWSSILVTTKESDRQKTELTQSYRNMRELLHALENEDIRW